MAKERITKKDIILEHLRKGEHITQMDAYRLCLATRLSAIIYDLKDEGWDIKTDTLKSSDGTHYASYYL